MKKYLALVFLIIISASQAYSSGWPTGHLKKHIIEIPMSGAENDTTAPFYIRNTNGIYNAIVGVTGDLTANEVVDNTHGTAILGIAKRTDDILCDTLPYFSDCPTTNSHAAGVFEADRLTGYFPIASAGCNGAAETIPITTAQTAANLNGMTVQVADYIGQGVGTQPCGIPSQTDYKICEASCNGTTCTVKLDETTSPACGDGDCSSCDSILNISTNMGAPELSKKITTSATHALLGTYKGSQFIYDGVGSAIASAIKGNMILGEDSYAVELACDADCNDNDRFTASSHSFQNGDMVWFASTLFGVTTGQPYRVCNVSSSYFSVDTPASSCFGSGCSTCNSVVNLTSDAGTTFANRARYTYAKEITGVLGTLDINGYNTHVDHAANLTAGLSANDSNFVDYHSGLWIKHDVIANIEDYGVLNEDGCTQYTSYGADGWKDCGVQVTITSDADGDAMSTIWDGGGEYTLLGPGGIGTIIEFQEAMLIWDGTGTGCTIQDASATMQIEYSNGTRISQVVNTTDFIDQTANEARKVTNIIPAFGASMNDPVVNGDNLYASYQNKGIVLNNNQVPRTIESNATVCANDGGSLQIDTAVADAALSVDDAVLFTAGTGALCTGISETTKYYVTEVDATDKFNISTEKGGTNISYTDTGTAFTSEQLYTWEGCSGNLRVNIKYKQYRTQ